MLRVALAVALILLVAAPATQSAAVHRVQFVFSQGGLPKEESLGGAVSTTNGRGHIIVPRPLRPGPSGYFEVKARVAKGDRFVHVDRVGGRMLRLVLAPIGASVAAFADGSKLLALTVRVAASTDPDCPRGRAGTLTLEDNRSEDDVLRLRLCPPMHEQLYQDGVRGRVWVQIG